MNKRNLKVKRINTSIENYKIIQIVTTVLNLALSKPTELQVTNSTLYDNLLP
jgi:hypothetical protein